MEYLLICYYNLKEKYLRGGVKEEDWNKVENKVKELILEYYKMTDQVLCFNGD